MTVESCVRMIDLCTSIGVAISRHNEYYKCTSSDKEGF